MISNSGKLKKGRPIVFKDGKKVDMSSVNDQWIDGDILTEEMRYISRMTEGLATGTMTGNKEYVELKNKVVKEMIADKVVALKKRLCEMAKEKSTIYDHAALVQDQTLERVQSYAQQVAKDNSIAIYLDDLTGEYKISRTPNPVTLKHNYGNCSSYKWHTIDAAKLKKEIAEREVMLEKITKQSRADDEILKEVEAKLKAQCKSSKNKKKTTKKKAVKKTMKKKTTKKKVKKNDRK